ncbi:RING finger protein [Quillaja saponaria]|uniref:RING finger protein n=1 Tax=Quillaja saponaria TaxID=32244 RepID=A0AAD7LSL3_QUISA|nr:RING finger protein [Quillaja saponaria]
MKMPNPIAELLHLLGRLILIFAVLCFHPRLGSLIHGYQDQAEEDEFNRASPSMVPVPIANHVMSKLIKKKLQVMPLSKYLNQYSREGDEDSAFCAICLSSIEKSQEIRVPANCSHLYHRECMDEWVDQNQVTCPLCRLQLLPAQDDEIKGVTVRDPWRMDQRIAYLFGEDSVLESI